MYNPLHLLIVALSAIFNCLPIALLVVVIVILLRMGKQGGGGASLNRGVDLEERLRRLERLKEQGLISDAEYQATRQRILGEL